MSYLFLLEGTTQNLNNVTNPYNNMVKNTNKLTNTKEGKNIKLKPVKPKNPVKLGEESISPEELFDIESFHKDIDETTSTGSVGGSFVGPMGSSPIRRSSLFAPEGSPEHKEGKKILKKLEKPIGKIYTKKNLEETFLVSEDDLEETTTTGSVGGSYVQPGIWAKDLSNWRGTKKLYPGGKFVHVKERCKTFPYCDESPDAIELTDYPKDKIDSIFHESKKYTHDLSDDEMWNKRDSDYIKLVEIISSVSNLHQFPAVERVVELFKQKFDGYISKYLNNNIDSMLKAKYNELTNNQEISENEMKGSKEVRQNKEKDFDKTMKVLKNLKDPKEFNTVLKMVINFRVKYENVLTKDEIKKINDSLINKINDIKDVKGEVKEGFKIKSVHNKIKD